MTDEQAEELLQNNSWTKFSDARELLQKAAHIGAKNERKNIDAELHRLHAECNDLAHQLNESNERNGRIIAQRDRLLVALKALVEASDSDEWNGISTMKARAAIKSVEGE